MVYLLFLVFSLYGPFRKSFAKSAVLSNHMKLSSLHRESLQWLLLYGDLYYALQVYG